MQTIGRQTLWSYDSRGQLANLTNTDVRGATALRVSNYEDLASRIAALQYKNRDLVLLFRGQGDDYRNSSKNTSIRPNILRPIAGSSILKKSTVADRFARLSRYDKRVVTYADELWKGDKVTLELVQKHHILRWALLQHYELCKTPLLDVTHSLRIAASFATDAAESGKKDKAYVFVLGVPNLSGAVTASMEAGLQIIRLSSVCPPNAVRPHIQEGYLLGEYPEVANADQKSLYTNYELDFGRRLVSKFVFSWKKFWDSSPEFPRVPHGALYPKVDEVADWTEKLKPRRKK